jgi:hypothetical protein
VLIAASLVIGWALVEAGGRLVLGLQPLPAERVGVFTSPNWVAQGLGVRWSPNQAIRTLAIYDGRIAYDVRFRTNDRGFIDHRDYGVGTTVPLDQRWAFVGDSFTAGHHGGDPWVPRLRDAVVASGRSIEIYNLGVSALGIRQLLPTLRGSELEVGHIVFLLISDDALRRPWRPIETRERVILCPRGAEEQACASYESRLLLLHDPHATQAEVLELVERSGPPPPALGSLAWLAQRSLVAAAFAGPGEPDAVEVELADWLTQVDRHFPDAQLHFLQIPEKDEVRRGVFRAPFADTIREAGHRYVSLLEACALRTEHYFELDPHMRQSGYDELGRCVGRVLELL